MARNGAGTYTLPAGNPVVAGTTISSATHNNTMNDVATAITASIAADGQTPITANLPMNNFRHTGVGNAIAQGQYASVSQVQNGAFNFLTSVSGTDAIIANSTISPAAYADGQRFAFVPVGTNTTSATINVNGLGVIDILRQDGSSTQAGDIVSGDPVEIEYVSGDFFLVSSNLESLGVNNKAVLKDSSNITATAAGTADAITASFSPAILALSDSLKVQINGLSPNTATNPTLNIDGLGAITIYDANLDAIPVGAMPETGEFRFKTGSPNKAILLNPNIPDQIFTIGATVADNAMTITFHAGQLVSFRSATITSGAVTSVKTSSALSLVIPSGATLGTTNAVAARYDVFIVNNAGTPVLAVCNHSGSHAFNESALISTTAITDAADSANVIYSTDAQTNKAWRFVGYIEHTQATAGTYATAPSKIQGAGGLVEIPTEYDSGEQAVVVGGLLSLTHGLFGKPKNIQVIWRCIDADAGYAVGQEVIIPPTNIDIGTANRGYVVYSSDTTIYVQIGSHSTTIIHPNAGVTAIAALTLSKWKIIVRASR